MRRFARSVRPIRGNESLDPYLLPRWFGDIRDSLFRSRSLLGILLTIMPSFPSHPPEKIVTAFLDRHKKFVW